MGTFEVIPFFLPVTEMMVVVSLAVIVIIGYFKNIVLGKPHTPETEQTLRFLLRVIMTLLIVFSVPDKILPMFVPWLQTVMK